MRPIAEIDEFNKAITTYPSVKKAAEFNHINPHTIRDMLSGKTKFANGKKKTPRLIVREVSAFKFTAY